MIRGLSSMKKKQFKYVCHGRKYSCLLLVSYLSNNIEMLWQFNSILLLLFQISILHPLDLQMYTFGLRKKMQTARSMKLNRQEKLESSQRNLCDWLRWKNRNFSQNQSIWKPLRDVTVTANVNLLNELQDVRNLSLIHRNWFTDKS